MEGGADWIDALSRYDGLLAVRLTPLGVYATGLSATFVPAERPAAERTLQVLANHDIVATADVAPADRLVLPLRKLGYPVGPTTR